MWSKVCILKRRRKKMWEFGNLEHFVLQKTEMWLFKDILFMNIRPIIIYYFLGEEIAIA